MSPADTLHALHQGPDLLILPNAWDAGSARLVESLGAPAVATSSAALAWANGYADGHDMPVDVLVAAVRAIARVIRAPLTVDCEGGYADAPAAVAANIARVIDAGAAGCNLEDGAESPDRHAAKIAAVRAAADKAGVRFFINARTDVWLGDLAEPAAMRDEAIRRGKLYREAGASGLFAPGLVALDDFAAIADGVGLPLNAMAKRGLPSRSALVAAGVRRLSAGTGVARAAMEAARAAAAAFLATGDSDSLVAAGGAPSDWNALFRGRT